MEQEQISVFPAQSDKKGETSYGKFNSAEELLKAYSALESEFTKRSQKLKEYEAQIKNADAAARLKEQEPTERKGKSDGGEEPQKRASEPNGTDRVSGEENRNAVVENYLKEIRANASPTVFPKGGAIPVAPAYKPKNLREASEIAKKLFDRMD